MKTDIRTAIHNEAERAPDPNFDFEAIRRAGARRRRISKLTQSVSVAAFIVGAIAVTVVLAPDPTADTVSPQVTDTVRIANPELPEDARQVITSSVPGLGTFNIFFSGPTTEVIEGETLEMGCMHIVAPETDTGVVIGGTTLCGEHVAPEVFGVYSYGNCHEVTGEQDEVVSIRPEGAVVSILGLDQGETTTLRFTLDNSETVEITTDEVAALFAWKGDHVLTDIQISGKTTDEIGSAIELPIAPCD